VDLEKVLDKLSKKERELITNADKALYEAKRAGKDADGVPWREFSGFGRFRFAALGSISSMRRFHGRQREHS
jgi:hypothetical protein